MKQLQKIAAGLLVCALLCGMVFSAGAEGSAPVAENLEISTYRGVSVGGRLSAKDPDGGTLSYQITTDPSKGTIELDEDGHFVYTPANGKRGKDYFGYRAADAEGNRSQEATVIIRIEKQKSRICYEDLAGNACERAAVRLAEEGIYTGACVAGVYCFAPDTPVTRSEFLTMCMKAVGSPATEGVRSTGFADDSAIAVWAKPYVDAALRRGIISGYAENGSGTVFCPDQAISAAEAAAILDRAAKLTDAVATWFAWDASIPAWAVQSAANVSSCGLLPYGCSLSAETLTRAQAAEMLCAAMDLIAKR